MGGGGGGGGKAVVELVTTADGGTHKGAGGFLSLLWGEEDLEPEIMVRVKILFACMYSILLVIII